MATIRQRRAQFTITAFLAPLLAVLCLQGEAHAWLFHEHHELGVSAVDRLSQARREKLQAMWAAWRTQANQGARLCQAAAAGPSRLSCSGEDCATIPGSKLDVSDCIDFAMLPAIAADHSCTPGELTTTVSSADWLRSVIRIAFETRALIEQGESAGDRLDAWHNSHIKLEMVDNKYLSRAEANNAHFMLVRESADDLGAYSKRVLDPKSPVSAIGLYIAYHRAALEFALQLSQLSPSDPTYITTLHKALSTEAFALHFLEDAFSAGHTVGTWGIAPERMGTHDYYCENGIDAETWTGHRYTAKGDGNMEPKDIGQAAPAINESLSQFIDAALGEPSIRDALPRLSDAQLSALHELDSCNAKTMPGGLLPLATHPLSHAVLQRTIRPSLGQSDAHLPRFRNEVGSFMRFYSGVRFGGNFAGYQSPAPLLAPRFRGDLEVGVAVGYGFEGIVTRSTDGVVFLQLTGVAQSKEKDTVCPDPCLDDRTISGDGKDRVPSRIGLGVKLRVPNLLLPGDSLVLVPLTMLFDFDAGKRLALAAANGGVGRLWRRRDRGQLVLFREVGVNVYGALFGQPVFERPDGKREAFTSVEVDLPIYEYRPLRRFNTDQTSTVIFQVGASGDFNRFGHAVFIYGRAGFDGRVYF